METMETMEDIEIIEKNTILIADDAEINREMIKFIFDEQYNIIEAENGEQAIEIIKKDSDKLCLLFLDLLVPFPFYDAALCRYANSFPIPAITIS